MQKSIYILGINHVYHELSACLLKDGIVVAAVEEERFTRIKRGKKALIDNPDIIPVNSIDFCLKKAGVTFNDLAAIALSFDPKARLKNIGVEQDVESGGWGTKEGEEMFYKKLIGFPAKLSDFYNCNITSKVHWISHHLAHAASSYLASPYNESAILAIDGIGEFDTAFLGKGVGDKIERIREIEYPNSLGFVWEKMAQFLGFTEYDAGKIMGFTAYGNPQKYLDSFRKVINIGKGSFTVDNSIFKFRSNDFLLLENLFGLKKIDKWSEKYIQSEYVHLAASLQQITEEIVLELVRSLKEETSGCKNLCLSGGVALNCLMNSKVLESGLFEDVYIQPASNDAGTALGAAMYVWTNILDHSRVFVMDNAYLGPDFTDEEITNAIRKLSLKFRKSENICEETAKLLAEEKIVGWFQGRMEFGPRALGNRSLLADPRKIEMKEKINKVIKKRENFRPFAPSVLIESASEWFEIGPNIPISVDFMLFSFKVRSDKIPLIPAVQQIDNTARIQTVRKETNKRYHDLISAFYRITDIPMLLNTSFNDNEPIVCTPEDAIRTFINNEFDVLVLGDYIIEK